MNAPPADTSEPLLARLAALRAGGEAPRDAVQLAYLEALARRLPAWRGAARARIEARLQAGVADYAERQAAIASADADANCAAVPAVAHGGPLGELVARLAAEAPAVGHGLKAAHDHQGTWSALSVTRDVARARARAPENAGPLNSHALAVRACLQLQDDAPAYLAGWLRYLDALFWLEQAVEPAAAAAGGEGGRRRTGARRKAGKS